MTPTKKTRWLRVARKASEFRLLQGSGEVAEAKEQAEAAQASLSRSQEVNRQMQAAWRTRLSQPVFHAGDDAQFRRYGNVLREAELQHDEKAKQARVGLEAAQQALRLQLAEKNALQAAIDNESERTRLEQVRSGQKETDDVWSVAQHGHGGQS